MPARTRRQLTCYLASALLLVGQVLAGQAAEANGAATQKGIASFYHDRFHGRTTASGEPFDQNQLTAAHRHLPFGTEVVVTQPDTGREVTVVINDRGPFVRGRIIDLSQRAAEELGILEKGVAPVIITAAD